MQRRHDGLRVFRSDAGALHGALQGLARTDLDGDVLGTLEAGLGLGAGEGYVLQSRQGGRIQGRLLRVRSLGVVGGQLPAQAQGGQAGDRGENPRRPTRCAAARIKFLHRAPVGVDAA